MCRPWAFRRLGGMSALCGRAGRDGLRRSGSRRPVGMSVLRGRSGREEGRCGLRTAWRSEGASELSTLREAPARKGAPGRAIGVSRARWPTRSVKARKRPGKAVCVRALAAAAPRRTSGYTSRRSGRGCGYWPGRRGALPARTPREAAAVPKAPSAARIPAFSADIRECSAGAPWE